MQRRILGNIVSIGVVAGVGVGFSVDECLAGGQRCVLNDSATHETCVEWSLVQNPVLHTDFDVDYECTGCYEAPEIELLTGDDQWRVWTYARSAGERIGMGDIGSLTTDPLGQESFGVGIDGGSGLAGAVNVGLIDLTVHASYHTSLTGSKIAGDLTGNLIVQESGGQGGTLEFEIGGEVDGNVTAENVKQLETSGDFDGIMNIGMVAENGGITIGGDLTGSSTIDVDEIDHGGVFEVKGAVEANTIVTLEDMSDATDSQQVQVKFNTTAPTTDTFSGDLRLTSGIPEYATVRISGVTQSGADIDLYDKDVVGTLEFERGGHANILNGGSVKDGTTESGVIHLTNTYLTGAQAYSGAAEFVDVEDGGLIKTSGINTLTFDGTLTVVDLYGRIQIWGRLDGDITVTGAMKGGELLVTQGVLSNADVYVADMVSESGYPSYLELLGAYFDGDLDLISGIGTDQNVNVGRVGGSINLHNADVAGWLELASVSEAGTISNGGSVSGWVRLGCSEDFDGTATFASVASTGRMYTHYSSDLTGDLTILGSMGGTISLARDLTSDGRISIGDDLTETGEIMVAGDVAGDIDIVDDVTGDITIDGDLSGDIDIDDAVSGGIEVQGTLKGSGRILIDGVCIGEITIGEQTEQLSQIVIYGGLDDFAGPPAKVGSITINADGGDFDANGTIHIGPSWTLPPPDVVFDGRILIQKQEEGVGGGDLGNRGRIEVFGCHATEDDLDICICGDVNGTIDIEQTGCTNQVTWDCLQEHPCFPDA